MLFYGYKVVRKVFTATEHNRKKMNTVLKKSMRLVSLCTLLMASTLSLQGCVALVAGGAAIGTMSMTDRRTLGAQTEDKGIALKAQSIVQEIVGNTGNVTVTSFNRKVLLTGEVAGETTKEQVASGIRALHGVEGLVNEIAITWKSGFTSKTNDALITGKVVAALIAEKKLSLNLFKVVTERGNVYLMGVVTRQEAAIAADLARQVAGVQSVVKVLDYRD